MVGGAALAVGVAFVLAWLALRAFSEAIVAYLFESHASANARRSRYPPGQHDRPTPAIEPPEHRREIHESWAFHKLPDGRRLWWQRLLPDGRPRAVVIFLHGFEDHSSFSLYNTARAFAEHTGCVALLVDQPGHGRSDGLHALVPDWTTHLIAIEHWCDTVCAPERRAHAPSAGHADAGAEEPLPLFAFGSSMGGAIAVSLAMRRPDFFSGLMLIAPMVRLAEGLRPRPHVAVALRLLAAVPVLCDLALIPRSDRTRLNYAAAATWRLDEHLERNGLAYMGRTRMRTARALLAATDAISSHMEALRTPFLVLHGTQDKTTAPEMSKELVRRAQSTDRACELVEGATHGLHYGEDAEVMLRVHWRLFMWLDAHCA
ncbi:hypothetical protein KFE25_010318 [Diacronema lutheri]|uniref:Serine aminopeptidase S33 domain-containing protein n=1 Tax=Diacronema lutheri TaxID=2081491 RepID=A0A8J5XEM2_DIALT|nr:hypothetical protein KFE25_010318 [Diacronema lutheri]|mmetsp:Transcript_3264/g.10172  ORF Transcript_3264/g.10172 Transcript_3264/m.10172 type:complete len:374 (-) Transcript_3264:34-1155(-)